MKIEGNKRIVEIGDVFGELTVLARDYSAEESRRERGLGHRKMYICKCSCGAEKSIVGTYLTMSRNPTRSCGAKEHRRGHYRSSEPRFDLTGQTFGKLKVLHPDTSVHHGENVHLKWVCKCECGGTKSVRSSYLRSGQAVDCGCGRWQRMSDAMIHDLTGITFGHLHVIGRNMDVAPKAGRHAVWDCRCDLCGQIERVESPMLEHYGKDRCLACCGKSLGETKIKEFFDTAGIQYVYDMHYGNCRSVAKDGCLRFDFRVTDPKTNRLYMIEFDGEQHFKEVPTWRTTDIGGLATTIERDEAKNRWCAENDVPMIRIPYTRLKDMCLEDLLLETSTFIIGGQREEHMV